MRSSVAPLAGALIVTLLAFCGVAAAARARASLTERVRRKLAQVLPTLPDAYPYQPMPRKPGAIVNGPSARGIAGDVPFAFTQYSSAVNPAFVGPLQTIKTAIVNDDVFPPTATFPLYRGFTTDNETGSSVTFWYILTDASDEAIANEQGVNFAQKLSYATAPGAARAGFLDNNLGLHTEAGYVDFSPVHNVVAGDAPNYFPPNVTQPGSYALDGYTPLVKVGSIIYNMPIVAGNVSVDQLNRWCNGIPDNETELAYSMVHDKVVAICPGSMFFAGEAPNNYDAAATVTLRLTQGWSWGRPVVYLSTDASNALLASLESATMAPALDLLGLAGDDVLFSPIEDLFTIINGFTNADINPAGLNSTTGETQHPQRQGQNSALRGDPAGPLNILGGTPTISTDYSPIWDVTAVQWTEYAIQNNYRARIIDQITAMGFVARGFLEELNTTDSFAVNCPVVKRYL